MSEVRFTMVGADGRLYGPVPATTIREWLHQGRANRSTQLCKEGENQWKSLGTFEEFELKSTAVPPSLSSLPPMAASTGDQIADQVTARGYLLGIFHCLERSWRLVGRYFWLTVGASTLVALLYTGIACLPAVGGAALVLLHFVLLGGLLNLFLRLLRGEPADIGTAFSGFGSGFVPLLLSGLVAVLLTAVGLLCCLVPGIYLLVAWHMFAPLLIVDRKLDFWDALECSRRIVTLHWWRCCGLMLVILILIKLGLLACFVGIFVTLPLAMGMIVYAYEDILGTAGTTLPSPLSSGPSPEPEPAMPPSSVPPASDPAVVSPEATGLPKLDPNNQPPVQSAGSQTLTGESEPQPSNEPPRRPEEHA